MKVSKICEETMKSGVGRKDHHFLGAEVRLLVKNWKIR